MSKEVDAEEPSALDTFRVFFALERDVLVLSLAMFAFSFGFQMTNLGLRFAGLPSHKALIVGPAEQGAGGRVTESYYLVRNTIVIPSAPLGGLIWEGLSTPRPAPRCSLGVRRSHSRSPPS